MVIVLTLFRYFTVTSSWKANSSLIMNVRHRGDVELSSLMQNKYDQLPSADAWRILMVVR